MSFRQGSVGGEEVAEAPCSQKNANYFVGARQEGLMCPLIFEDAFDI
jgi:hypothetical protein